MSAATPAGANSCSRTGMRLAASRHAHTRQRLARFVRRTRSFSRSDPMHLGCLQLFLHRYKLERVAVMRGWGATPVHFKDGGNTNQMASKLASNEECKRLCPSCIRSCLRP